MRVARFRWSCPQVYVMCPNSVPVTFLRKKLSRVPHGFAKTNNYYFVSQCDEPWQKPEKGPLFDTICQKKKTTKPLGKILPDMKQLLLWFIDFDTEASRVRYTSTRTVRNIFASLVSFLFSFKQYSFVCTQQTRRKLFGVAARCVGFGNEKKGACRPTQNANWVTSSTLTAYLTLYATLLHQDKGSKYPR